MDPERIKMLATVVTDNEEAKTADRELADAAHTLAELWPLLEAVSFAQTAQDTSGYTHDLLEAKAALMAAFRGVKGDT